MKKALTLVLFTFSLILLTGCENTVQGFGKDMQQNGREIQKSVQ